MLIDISIPLGAETVPWPGDTPFSCGWSGRLERGDSVNLTALTFSPHVGTHADAPLHVHSGWPASETLTVSAFVGPAVVLTVPTDYPIDTDLRIETLQAMLAAVPDATAIPGATSRILLRTGQSIAGGHFPTDWPTLAVETARWLVDQGLQLWGTDAPSADRRTSTALPVHHALLGGGANLLENLALTAIVPGVYDLIAPPLLVVGADAAPVRALLRERRPPV